MRFMNHLFAAALGLALAAGAQSAEKVYQAATNAAFPPFESLSKEQKAVGFDIDILTAIAARGGFEVRFRDTPWEGIFATLASGDSDIIASAVTITEARRQTMEFSDPYFEARQLIGVDEASPIKGFADLKERKVGVQTGATGDEVVQKLLGKSNPNIKRFDSIPLALQELLSGGVDAVVADNGVVANFIANNKSAKLKTLEDPGFVKEYYGFAVRKDDKELVAKINKGLAAIKADGTYDKIYRKYFGN